MNLKSFIIYFLSDPLLSSFENAKKYLISLRKTLIDGYDIKESRSLWFSLILYKFRHEHETTDELWHAARSFIIDTLRDQPNEQSARQFLTVFNTWKDSDFNSFVNEVVGYYLQVLHLKQTIEETREQETIAEWKDNYQALLIKIRNAAEKMGFLHQLDEKVKEVENVRRTIVSSVMHRAYWDMLEDDVRNKRYVTVICQLTELKDLIKDIIPQQYHDDLNDKFNVEYVRQRIEMQTFDQEYVINLCSWVLNTMKEWDSENSRHLYDREIATWESAFNKLEWHTFIRFSLELCTMLALDAKTRISIWKSLLREVTKK